VGVLLLVTLWVLYARSHYPIIPAGEPRADLLTSVPSPSGEFAADIYLHHGGPLSPDWTAVRLRRGTEKPKPFVEDRVVLVVKHRVPLQLTWLKYDDSENLDIRIPYGEVLWIKRSWENVGVRHLAGTNAPPPY
jgi:hypothetical protein